MATFTVRQVSADGPTRAEVTVAGVPGGANIVVERSTDRNRWVPVRGAAGVPMPYNTAAFPIYDWAAPLGARTFYRLIVAGSVLAETEIVLSANGTTWLQDAFAPHRGVPIRLDRLDAANALYGVEAFREASWPQEVSEAHVMGSHFPVESVATRQRAGQVPIQIHALIPSVDVQLREMLLNAGPLLIRGAPCNIMGPAQYVVIPDLHEAHLGNPHEVATFYGTARFTVEPAPAAVVGAWTWQQLVQRIRILRGQQATWADVRAATPRVTWRHIANNPPVWGAGS